MGSKRSSLNRINGKGQNSQREVRPEVFGDNIARNQLINNKEVLADDKARASRKRGQNKLELKKDQSRLRLYGRRASEKNAKNKQKYTDKELSIPTLNRSIIPGFQVKKGKKGKKLIADDDTLLLTRLVKSIGDEYDHTVESKLEKDRRLQDIRDLKRQEIERKEEAKLNKLEDKKSELKNKANAARSLRRKNQRDANKVTNSSAFVEEHSSKKKKTVSFA
ncbi:similar to Saccharomyces cerevisiae YFR001W LOC1 Nuclear protein involved in asymmetric localization of ASH1 mRNA [Maudiozyma barnettii]|uniref:60S ribosomal subunit assembly/export protein LOC1 n=1 Tax=Maudiozyma barnettii TaxID=61262 RepID=A0A8H2ZGA3_9SACH|nr:Loc1p [Kazachstania barnettii]CAB4254379.1 similar to Saccharomyces cerevisiae YFR001W LOC1 Nuclear protein involved in asymmetric localization of ASH1 mRNA [Kazachstania barnettii]CAD1782269.1 similar to Saccharomyces cerevisiae YFR001W LOC1 Nuclear protein involved in asymmetric localization of ASH1 mRNA [Kazachstania barnettii]